MYVDRVTEKIRVGCECVIESCGRLLLEPAFMKRHDE